MDANLGDVPREGLLLPRFFAVILLAFAAILGLPLVLMLSAALMSWDWPPLAAAAFVAPVSWTLAWLGRLLWSGRPIPTWFILAFCAGIVVVPAALMIAEGQWGAVLILLSTVIPGIAQLGWVRRAKPKRLDELG